MVMFKTIRSQPVHQYSHTYTEVDVFVYIYKCLIPLVVVLVLILECFLCLGNVLVLIHGSSLTSVLVFYGCT